VAWLGLFCSFLLMLADGLLKASERCQANLSYASGSSCDNGKRTSNRPSYAPMPCPVRYAWSMVHLHHQPRILAEVGPITDNI